MAPTFSRRVFQAQRRGMQQFVDEARGKFAHSGRFAFCQRRGQTLHSARQFLFPQQVSALAQVTDGAGHA